MDRINHVKVISPDPAAVDRFLREVVDMPDGWSMGSLDESEIQGDVTSPARDANGVFNRDGLLEFRGGLHHGPGFIVGDARSRQVQIVHADTPRIWAIAIGTRDVDGAHERCVEQGFPCTDVEVTDWHDSDSIRFFYAEVGGLVFEVLCVLT